MAAREYLSNPLLADFGVKLGSRNIGVREDRLDGSEVRAVIDVRIILPTDTRVSICESGGMAQQTQFALTIAIITESGTPEAFSFLSASREFSRAEYHLWH